MAEVAKEDARQRFGPEIWNLGFDPEQLRLRYVEERDRRIRSDAGEQFVTVGEGKGAKFSDWLTDPWVPRKERAPETFTTSALIVGAGFTGLLLGSRLRQNGISDFRIMDKAGDFGGTWYWNRYPGAACDSEAYCYLPMLEDTGYMPSRKQVPLFVLGDVTSSIVRRYVPAPEILRYAQRIAKQFDLYSNAMFHTSLIEARWDDTAKVWTGFTDRGDRFTTKFLMVVGGPLNCPHLPDVPGIDSFEGKEFHTARWDYAYTGGDPMKEDYNMTKLADKTVAIIGTGATAVQCIPYLAASAKKLLVFQRTPAAVDVRANRPTDPAWWKELTSHKGWHAARDERFQRGALVVGYDNPLDDGFSNSLVEWAAFATRKKLSGGKEGAGISTGALYQLGDYRIMERIRKRVEDTIVDKKLAEALKPWYNLWCKRPVYSDEYLPAFNRPNVELVDCSQEKGIEAITPRGIVVGGKEHPVDCIVWSTGFTIAANLEIKTDYKIIGRDNLTPREKHAKYKFSTLFGVCTNGFPNAFNFGIAQAAGSPNFTSIFGIQATFVAGLVAEALRRGVAVLEVTREAEEAWTKEVQRSGPDNSKQRETCTPGYLNAEGDLEKLKVIVDRARPHGAGPLVYRDRIFGHLAKAKETGVFDGFAVSYAAGKGDARL
ncbi:cyclododecanone monooxygenase [Hyaloraphidium curvatum]|nr:cyclododecanone monooxygenase [Hyaloraphidium curvatum]